MDAEQGTVTFLHSGYLTTQQSCVFVLDTGAELFMWSGRGADFQVSEKRIERDRKRDNTREIYETARESITLITVCMNPASRSFNITTSPTQSLTVLSPTNENTPHKKQRS